MRYDHQWHRQATGRRRTAARGIGAGAIGLMAAIGVTAGLGFTAMTAPPARPLAVGESYAAHFSLCKWGGGTNCVVDGDTFWMAGEKIRVADIDAPETHPSRCAEEARLGDAATVRLQALLNAGPVTLTNIDRDTDCYGRKLRIVERDGRSLGDTLVGEGLARTWTGRRMPWC